MLQNAPDAKLRPIFKKKHFENARKVNPLIWLNYHMFLRKLAKLSAEKAKEEKMAVIQKHHVQEAAKTVLRSFKG